MYCRMCSKEHTLENVAYLKLWLVSVMLSLMCSLSSLLYTVRNQNRSTGFKNKYTFYHESKLFHFKSKLFHSIWNKTILFHSRTNLFLKPVLVTNLFYNLSWFLRVYKLYWKHLKLCCTHFTEVSFVLYHLFCTWARVARV